MTNRHLVAAALTTVIAATALAGGSVIMAQAENRTAPPQSSVNSTLLASAFEPKVTQCSPIFTSEQDAWNVVGEYPSYPSTEPAVGVGLLVAGPAPADGLLAVDFFAPGTSVAECMSELGVIPGSVFISRSQISTGQLIEVYPDGSTLNSESDGSKVTFGPINVEHIGGTRSVDLVAETQAGETIRIGLAFQIMRGAR